MTANNDQTTISHVALAKLSTMRKHERLLALHLLTPGDDGEGLPCMTWGAPGGGKTTLHKQVSLALGIPIMVIPVGLVGEGAFGVTGVPRGDGEHQRIAYPAPDWTDVIEDVGETCTIYLDEITTAAPSLQPPLLGLLQERRVGNRYLGGGVRCFASGNPVDSAANGFDMPSSIANRMAHYEHELPPATAWSGYMAGRRPNGMRRRAASDDGGWFMPDPADANIVHELTKELHGVWDQAYAKVAGPAIGFVTRRPALLHKEPDQNDPARSRAWASHRSWTAALYTATTAHILGWDDLVQDVLTAWVGAGAVIEYITWSATADLPDPARWLDGKETFKHDPARLDRTAVAFQSASMLVAPTSCDNRQQRAAALWAHMDALSQVAGDLIVPAAIAMVKAPQSAQLTGSKEATKVLAKLHPLFSAAGVL